MQILAALKESRVVKAVKWLVLTILTVIIVSLGLIHILPDFNLYLVRSESMKPAINMGDIVITRAVDSQAGRGVEPGMVITFEHDDKMLTHRVVSVNGDTVVTKGDAMEEADPWSVPLSDIKGACLLRIPYVGYVSSFVGSKLGWFLLIILPAMLLISLFIKEILKEAFKKNDMKGDLLEEPKVGHNVETAGNAAARAVPVEAAPGDTPSSAVRDIPTPTFKLDPTTVSEILAEVTEPPVEEAATVLEKHPEPPVEEAAPVLEKHPEPPVEEAAPVLEKHPEPAAQTEQITQAQTTVAPSEALATADEIGKSAMEYIHTSMSTLEEWLTTLEKTAYNTAAVPPQAPKTGAAPRLSADAEAIDRLVEQSVKGSTRAFQERLNSLGAKGQTDRQQPPEHQPSRKELQHVV